MSQQAPAAGVASAAPEAPAAYLVVASDALGAGLLLGALSPEQAATATCLLVGTDVIDEPLSAARVLLAPGAAIDEPVDGLAPAIAAYVGARTVVLLDSSQAARDLAGWLVANQRAEVAWAVERVDGSNPDHLLVERVVNGGDARLRQRIARSAPVVLLVRRTGGPSTFEGPAPVSARVSFGARATAVVRAADDEEIAADASAEVPLTGARVVVAVGRGIGGEEHVPLFSALAAELGGVLGATRVVVDLGWLPFAHQVGQTGAAVAPDLYIAFGVSGAVQHLVGMRDSTTIVAVNTDVHAPICELADVVIDGDAVQVASALLTHIQQRPGDIT